jgi:antitoxin component YwqK of YwqJK toxin-antitoxin module
MNLMRDQIERLFTNPQETLEDGLWFSGIEGEGEYKQWYDNGKIFLHCFYKNDKKDGEHRKWHYNGQIWVHLLYKDGKIKKDYLN